MEIDQPSWVEIFQAHADRVKSGIHTALPGRVVSYDVATQLASVQVGVQVETEDGFAPLEPLTDVPVAWPAGGGFACTMPLAAGDPVLVVFLEADDTAHRASGAPEPPANVRRHGLWPRCIPCGGLDGRSLPATAGKLVVSSADGSGASIVLDSTSVQLGAAGGGFVALASLVAAELAKITTWAGLVTTATGVAPLAPFASTAATKAKAT